MEWASVLLFTLGMLGFMLSLPIYVFPFTKLGGVIVFSRICRLRFYIPLRRAIERFETVTPTKLIEPTSA